MHIRRWQLAIVVACPENYHVLPTPSTTKTIDPSILQTKRDKQMVAGPSPEQL